MSRRGDAGFVKSPAAWRGIRYDFQPVLDLSRESTQEEIAQRAGYSDGSVTKSWREHGLTWTAADKVACSMGLHPGNIWLRWFEDVQP
jgi:hypothetical protein